MPSTAKVSGCARPFCPTIATATRSINTALAPSFLVLVEIVHHLGADPPLPPELIAGDWPGPELRNQFTSLELAWQQLLATWRRSLH